MPPLILSISALHFLFVGDDPNQHLSAVPFAFCRNLLRERMKYAIIQSVSLYAV